MDLDSPMVGVNTEPSVWKRRDIVYENCLESAKKYKNATEWKANDPESFLLADSKGYLKKIYIMLRWRVERNWTFNICLRIAQEFKSSPEWSRSKGYAHHAYVAACNSKWLPEIKNRLNWLKEEYTYDDCLADAKKYKYALHWKNGVNSNSHLIAYKKGWLRQIALELGWSVKTEWSVDICLDAASKFASPGEWRRGDRRSYFVACRNRWLENIKKQLGWERVYKWNYESCKGKASNYTSLVDWSCDDLGSYEAACKHKWTRKIASELGWVVRTCGKRSISRTYQECKDDAMAYEGLTLWCRGSQAVYAYAYRRKWHNKIGMELGWKLRGKEPC
jgi:hypothetical protein